MRKIFFFTVIICLLSVAAFAQKSDFSGRWTLEVSRSKPDERARIESMTMTVTQTDKELKVETATKRAPRPEGAPGGTGGAGFGRGGGFWGQRRCDNIQSGWQGNECRTGFGNGEGSGYAQRKA